MSKGIDGSKILLACFGLNVNRQNLKDLTMQEISPIFAPFKSLARILIFTRKDLVKAFIQFEDREDAQQAKIQLDGNYYGKYGKMKLYFSQKKELDVSNEFFELWEPGQGDFNGNQLANRSKRVNTESVDSEEPERKKRFFKVNSGKNNREDRGTDFRRQKEGGKIGNGKNSTDAKRTKRNNLIQEKILEQNKEKSSFNISMFQNHLSKHPVNPAHKEKRYRTYFDLIQSSSTKIPRNQTPSKVVLLSNIGYVFKEAQEIHSLFSNFGNIRMIIFMKVLQKALIEYYTIDNAKRSIKNLNGTTLGPTTLNVQHSHYKQLMIEDQKENRDFCYFNEIIMVDKQMHRFNLRNYQEMRPASRFLMVSASSGYEFFADELMALIKEFCNPLKNSINIDLKGRNTVVFQISLEFESKSSAIYFMYKCHGKRVRDAHLSVRFSSEGEFDNH